MFMSAVKKTFKGWIIIIIIILDNEHGRPKLATEPLADKI